MSNVNHSYASTSSSVAEFINLPYRKKSHPHLCSGITDVDGCDDRKPYFLYTYIDYITRSQIRYDGRQCEDGEREERNGNNTHIRKKGNYFAEVCLQRYSVRQVLAHPSGREAPQKSCAKKWSPPRCLGPRATHSPAFWL